MRRRGPSRQWPGRRGWRRSAVSPAAVSVARRAARAIRRRRTRAALAPDDISLQSVANMVNRQAAVARASRIGTSRSYRGSCADTAVPDVHAMMGKIEGVVHMNRRITTAAAAAACVGALLSAPEAQAQTFTGRMDITIEDSYGGRMPGVTVELTGRWPRPRSPTHRGGAFPEPSGRHLCGQSRDSPVSTATPTHRGTGAERRGHTHHGSSASPAPPKPSSSPQPRPSST